MGLALSVTRRSLVIPGFAVVVLSANIGKGSGQTVLLARRNGGESSTHASLLLPERAVSEGPRSTGAVRLAWVLLSVGVNKTNLLGT